MCECGCAKGGKDAVQAVLNDFPRCLSLLQEGGGTQGKLLYDFEAQGEEDGQRGEAAVALGRLPLLAPDPAEVGLELDGCCSA